MEEIGVMSGHVLVSRLGSHLAAQITKTRVCKTAAEQLSSKNYPQKRHSHSQHNENRVSRRHTLYTHRHPSAIGHRE